MTDLGPVMGTPNGATLNTYRSGDRSPMHRL